MSESQQFRLERDSMGEFNVPVDAYYGANTMRAVLNFPISDLRFNRSFIEAIASVKLAASEVNLELGLLDENISEAIVTAAREVAEGGFDDAFVVDIFQDRLRHVHEHECQRSHLQPCDREPGRREGVQGPGSSE